MSMNVAGWDHGMHQAFTAELMSREKEKRETTGKYCHKINEQNRSGSPGTKLLCPSTSQTPCFYSKSTQVQIVVPCNYSRSNTAASSADGRGMTPRRTELVQQQTALTEQYCVFF